MRLQAATWKVRQLLVSLSSVLFSTRRTLYILYFIFGVHLTPWQWSCTTAIYIYFLIWVKVYRHKRMYIYMWTCVSERFGNLCEMWAIASLFHVLTLQIEIRTLTFPSGSRSRDIPNSIKFNACTWFVLPPHKFAYARDDARDKCKIALTHAYIWMQVYTHIFYINFATNTLNWFLRKAFQSCFNAKANMTAVHADLSVWMWMCMWVWGFDIETLIYISCLQLRLMVSVYMYEFEIFVCYLKL